MPVTGCAVSETQQSRGAVGSRARRYIVLAGRGGHDDLSPLRRVRSVVEGRFVRCWRGGRGRGDAAGASCGRLFARGAVDAFAEEIRVAIVARVFLDHVQVDPPQGVVLAGAGFVETAPGHGLTRPGDTHLIAGQVVGGTRDADLLEAFRRSRHIVPEILVVRLAVVKMEPGLDSRQVPNKAEQRELRRRHRPQRQLFRRQPATLQQQGRAVVLEAVFERGPLVNRVVRRLGSLGRGPCQHSGDFTYTRFLGQRAAVVGGSRHESSNPSTCTFPDTTVSATAEVRNRSQDGATVWATCQGWDGDRR